MKKGKHKNGESNLPVINVIGTKGVICPNCGKDHAEEAREKLRQGVIYQNNKDKK